MAHDLLLWRANFVKHKKNDPVKTPVFVKHEKAGPTHTPFVVKHKKAGGGTDWSFYRPASQTLKHKKDDPIKTPGWCTIFCF